jgi:anti-sigma factor RsiW
VINVFLWPVGHGSSAGAAAASRQGYHLRHWTTPGFVYWVASDLGAAELDQFADLLKAADAATP